MATRSQIQQKADIKKIWFEHEFEIHGPVVEFSSSSNEVHRLLHPIKNVDTFIVKHFLEKRITEIERMLTEISAVNNFFKDFQAQPERPSQFEIITIQENNFFKTKFLAELRQALNELKRIDSIDNH